MSSGKNCVIFLGFPFLPGGIQERNYMKKKEPEFHMIIVNGISYVMVDDVTKMLERLRSKPAEKEGKHENDKR